MSRDGKGEIEKKLDGFINTSFERFGLTNDDETMTRYNAAVLMQELMQKHGLGGAFDQKEFNAVFDLFEEDDPSE